MALVKGVMPPLSIVCVQNFVRCNFCELVDAHKKKPADPLLLLDNRRMHGLCENELQSLQARGICKI